MTNTIPNVPRELKPCPFCGDSELLGFEPSNEGGWTIVRCRRCGASGSTGRSTSEWEAAAYWNRRAPSPAGVDGLEVGDVECNCSWNPDSHDKTCPVYLRDRLSDAQAIIDGLRGEIEVMTQHANNYSRMFEECAEERDQHARLIGELASHLEFAVTMLTVAGLAGNAQVEAMRAALSAGKDSDQ